jgi:hypothetical protein
VLLAEFSRISLTSVSAYRVTADVEAPRETDEEQWYVGARVVVDLGEDQSANIRVDVGPEFAAAVKLEFPQAGHEVTEYEDLATIIVQEIYNSGVRIGSSPQILLDVIGVTYNMEYHPDEHAARVLPPHRHD